MARPARFLFGLALTLACSSDGGPERVEDAATPGEPDVAEDAGYDAPTFDAAEPALDRGPPPEVDPRGCSEIDRDLNEAFAAAWADPNACAEAADCVLYPVTFSCPGQTGGQGFKQCSLPVHMDSTSAVDALVAAVQDEQCPTLTGCFGVGDCFYSEADCVDGKCVPLYRP